MPGVEACFYTQRNFIAGAKSLANPTTAAQPLLQQIEPVQVGGATSQAPVLINE
jgi:hypothetical protein